MKFLEIFLIVDIPFYGANTSETWMAIKQANIGLGHAWSTMAPN